MRISQNAVDLFKILHQETNTLFTSSVTVSLGQKLKLHKHFTFLLCDYFYSLIILCPIILDVSQIFFPIITLTQVVFKLNNGKRLNGILNKIPSGSLAIFKVRQ